MFTRRFWSDAVERAVKTGAQTLAAMFAVGVTVLSIDWTDALAVSGTAMMLSVLTSIASTGVGDHTTAAALLDNDGGRWRRGKRVE
ncbi:holin [Gordonia sp. (in: high G+C Gram-positive bacteria)]|uniref:holin n=1 Tax=Gordonia sp. (in: high G+C Gram-positive bacteria) TaxID=84139 RepID=UPI003C71F509